MNELRSTFSPSAPAWSIAGLRSMIAKAWWAACFPARSVLKPGADWPISKPAMMIEKRTIITCPPVYSPCQMRVLPYHRARAYVPNMTSQRKPMENPPVMAPRRSLFSAGRQAVAKAFRKRSSPP